MYTLRRIHVDSSNVKSSIFHIFEDAPGMNGPNNTHPVAILYTKMHGKILADENEAATLALMRLADNRTLNIDMSSYLMSPAGFVDELNARGIDLLQLPGEAKRYYVRYITRFKRVLYMYIDEHSGGWRCAAEHRRLADELTMKEAVQAYDDTPPGSTHFPGDEVATIQIVVAESGDLIKERHIDCGPLYEDEAIYELVKSNPMLIDEFKRAYEARMRGEAKDNPFKMTAPQFKAYEFAWHSNASSCADLLDSQ
ncbi:hypothetical protein ACI2KR_27150 [Pseudomonas luteola]